MAKTIINKNGSSKVDVIEITKKVTVKAFSGNDKVTVKKGSGAIVYGGAGSDKIYVNAGSSQKIYGEAGADTITIGKSTGSGLRVYGGNTKYTLTDKDSFVINGGTKNYFYGGKGMDTFTINAGTSNNFYGNAGVDTFYLNGGKSNNLYGGIGNDVFVIGKYSTGTAFVKDFNIRKGEADKIKVTGGTVKSIKASGSNLIITGGKSASLTLVNAKGKSLSITDSRGSFTVSNTAITLGNNFTGSLNTSVLLPTTIKTVSGTDKADNITVSGGSGKRVFTRKGADTILVTSGKSHTIYSGANNDTITIKGGTEVEVFADTGADKIYINGGSGHGINSGDGDDKIFINAGSDHFIVKHGSSVAKGNDYVEINKGAGDNINISAFNGMLDGNETIVVNGGNKHWIQLGNNGEQVVTINSGNEHEVRLTGNALDKAKVTVNGGTNNHIVCEGSSSNTAYDINVLKGEGHKVDVSFINTNGTNITVAAKNVSLDLGNYNKANHVIVQWSDNIGTLAIDSVHDFDETGVANALTISGATSNDFTFSKFQDYMYLEGYGNFPSSLGLSVDSVNSDCHIKISNWWNQPFSGITFDNGELLSYTEINRKL